MKLVSQSSAPYNNSSILSRGTPVRQPGIFGQTIRVKTYFWVTLARRIQILKKPPRIKNLYIIQMFIWPPPWSFSHKIQFSLAHRNLERLGWASSDTSGFVISSISNSEARWYWCCTAFISSKTGKRTFILKFPLLESRV